MQLLIGAAARVLTHSLAAARGNPKDLRIIMLFIILWKNLITRVCRQHDNANLKFYRRWNRCVTITT